MGGHNSPLDVGFLQCLRAFNSVLLWLLCNRKTSQREKHGVWPITMLARVGSFRAFFLVLPKLPAGAPPTEVPAPAPAAPAETPAEPPGRPRLLRQRGEQLRESCESCVWSSQPWQRLEVSKASGGELFQSKEKTAKMPILSHFQLNKKAEEGNWWSRECNCSRRGTGYTFGVSSRNHKRCLMSLAFSGDVLCSSWAPLCSP